MILRSRSPRFFELAYSHRRRLSALAVGFVAASIALTVAIALWAASQARAAAIDTALATRAEALLGQVSEVEQGDAEQVRAAVADFLAANPPLRAAAIPAWSGVGYGDAVPAVPGPVGADRVVVRASAQGDVVALAQPADPSAIAARSAAAGLTIMVGLGALLAWRASARVTAAGERPIAQLRGAIEGVTGTAPLPELPVAGGDEAAEANRSFNNMVVTLREMRDRRAQLVADAGHELKTPLTSLRTNVELLVMAYARGREQELSATDRAELEQDVIGQMNELTSLVSDLMELARDDAPGFVNEEIRLDEVLGEAISRGERRRRPDVAFQYHADPWLIVGDADALVRAPLNIIDNAAKWSPPGGIVTIRLTDEGDRAVLIVDDSGPGIPPEERERVFERFYRSAKTRSTPGSGLGLAITKQVLEAHSAEAFAEESPDGGARVRVVFPGRAPGRKQ